jgi:monoamine oxidase
VPAIGALVTYKSAIRDPFMAIHWAGSESGLEWTGGYMNGAVQSGVRAAGEAINAVLSPAAAGQAAVDGQRNAAQ